LGREGKGKWGSFYSIWREKKSGCFKKNTEGTEKKRRGLPFLAQTAGRR